MWLAFRVVAGTPPRLFVVVAAVVLADVLGVELLARLLPEAGLLLALGLPALVLRRETG